MELNIKDFDELEQYFKRKQQHTEELEHENIELTRENMKLKREVRELKVERAKFVNQIIALKKSPADTEEVPKIFRTIK